MASRTWGFDRPAEPVRGWAVALFLALAFTVLVVVNRVFCIDRLGESAFWPANGALVVAFLVLRSAKRLIVALACLVVNLAANRLAHYNLYDNALFSVLNLAMSLAVAVLTRRYCGGATDLSRIRRLVTFALIALGVAGAEAVTGETLQWMAGEPAGVDDGVQWWLCDSLGLIVATPALLLLVKYKSYDYAADGRLNERMLLFSVTVLTTVAAFLYGRSAIFLFIYPLLVLLSFRAGPVWVLSGVMLAALIASGTTAHGLGPLAFLSKSGALLVPDMMQPYLLSLFLCAAPPNSVLGERIRTGRRLTRLNAAARSARRAADEANAAKSLFIANISHEIRTPLNGVLGMVELLTMSGLSKDQLEKLSVISASSEVLLSLLNDVLDLSKIEAGRLELETTSFNLSALCRGVVETFTPAAAAKGVDLLCDIRPSIEGTFIGDPTRVRQILTNLTSNAVKFTERGSVRIVADACGEAVLLQVADTGIGMPPDKLDRLFGKFEQLDASTTRRFGGTGLGLSICRDLAALMGGSLSVDSRLGAGSSFSVSLPLVRSETADLSAPQPETPTLERAEHRPEGALRVLAAEDNKTNQLVLTTLLAELGVQPTLVADGAAAVSAWEAETFDLILMDMQMPVMDGLSAIAAIRKAEVAAGRARTPIVAFTADVMSHHLDLYRAAGVEAVVPKPVQFRRLVDAINTALSSVSPTEASADPGLRQASV